MAFQVAVVYAFIGDADKTFEWLETSFEQRDGGITHMLVVQAFEPFHQDPRWQPFLLKVGLLDHWEKLQSRQEETEA
jgi:hypothetical protein